MSQFNPNAGEERLWAYLSRLARVLGHADRKVRMVVGTGAAAQAPIPVAVERPPGFVLPPTRTEMLKESGGHRPSAAPTVRA